MRVKRCKVCKAEFTPRLPMQKVCCLECAQALAKAERIKAERRQLILDRRKARTRRDIEKAAQMAFNAYIRARDADLPCISCGRMHGGQWHAGHYLSTGARPNLRFDEQNVHKQCQPCNTHLHGNAINYRIGLIARLGIEVVAKLESDHEPRKYSAQELDEIRAEYARRTRELKGVNQ